MQYPIDAEKNIEAFERSEGPVSETAKNTFRIYIKYQSKSEITL